MPTPINQNTNPFGREDNLASGKPIPPAAGSRQMNHLDRNHPFSTHRTGLRQDLVASNRSYCADGISSEDFDAIAAQFDDLCIDQIATYKTQEQPGRTSLFLSYQDGHVIGGAIVVIYALPLVGRGVANVRFGPFWRRNKILPSADNYAAIVRQLVQEYSDRRGLMLTILPRPHPSFGQGESNALLANGFEERSAPARSKRFFVDLTLSEQLQRQSLSQKWRYNLVKSENAGLSITQEDGPDADAAFAKIHDRMLARKKTKLADRLDIVPALRASAQASLRPRTYLARKGDEVVAGAIVLGLGDTAYYLYGATGCSGLDTRAGYALQWHIVNQLSTERFQYYDLGGSSCNDGLRQFKSGLCGRAGLEVEVPDEYDYSNNSLGALFGRSVHMLRYLKTSHGHIRNDVAQVLKR